MRCLVPLTALVALLGASVTAEAAPVLLDASNASAPAGLPGTGACAIARKGPAGQWISSLAQASSLLESPEDAAPTLHFPLTLTDVSNGTAQSGGDFVVDDPLPWSGGAVPAGDGELVAMRWVGLFRVEAPTTLTLAVRSDDGFSMSLGGTTLFSHLGVRTSHVDTRVVTFLDPGRYPFELIYFENLTDAVLEWSYAEGAVAEVSHALDLPEGEFQLVPVTMLAAPGNDPSACGSSCAPCGPDTPVCAGGLCVQLPFGPTAEGGDGVGGAGGESTQSATATGGGAGGAAESESGAGGSGAALDGSGGLPNDVTTADENATNESLLLGSGRCAVSPGGSGSAAPAALLGAALAWLARRRRRHA